MENQSKKSMIGGGGTPMTRKPPYHLSSFIIHTGSTGEG